MITPNEIRIKAEKKYNAYLQCIVEGIPFSQIVIMGNKKPSDSFSAFQQELSQLIENSKEKKGYGYSLKYQTIRKKTLGTQDIPTEIYFETESDFLKYLRKENEVAKFRENCTLILSNFPQLKDWMVKYPNKVVEYQSKWNDLLKVCFYFNSNPTPNLYIRELPILIHTKFIENNKFILRELLDIVINEHINHVETVFEQRFNLKCCESLIRFRILDKKISKAFISGIEDLSVPVSQFEQLELPIKNVLVVENKTNLHTIALTIPQLENTIVVFGSGYKVEKLKGIKWFNRVNLFYWGDLDVHGFEILSQFRGYFPHVKSILMDKDTFNCHFENDKGSLSKITTTLNLTAEEQELYELLKENNWRLEQEKIPQKYVNRYITAIVVPHKM